MYKMTGFQRTVAIVAAVIVALRVFFPITSLSGTHLLLGPTLLHVVGIVVLAMGVFILFPSPSWRSFLRWAATVALLAGWLLYVALALTLFGPSTADRQVGIPNWRASVFGVGVLLILAALTWLWTIVRRRRTFTPFMKTLAGVILIVGLSFVVLAILTTPLSTPPAPIAQTNPAFMPPTNTLPPGWRFVPDVPTVSELADQYIVQRASTVLEIYVDTGSRKFQELHASDKDALCEAGKAIRDSMKAHHNTLADLNHVEREIYNITAPAGRCH